MLFVDVEGEVSAASMVKDSKIYIEIAKFVQAYEAIIQDPNKFLLDIDERPIDSENEILTWDQFVNIATNCDLGFNPKPDAQTLAVYYSYAMQIGSISKEAKKIATVHDIAEAQKKYYNFIDDTTAKVENQYKKQHEIAERRAKDAALVESTISKKKLRVVGIFAAMAFGVFLCGLGLAGIFFDIGFVRFFGFGNRFIGGPILMAIGFSIFFFLDKFYLKFKRDYLVYKSDSQCIISRSERTSRDELVLKDKLDKYQEDLKIAKYELADKNQTYDVAKCIERLREKNKYFQGMLDRESLDSKLGLYGEKGMLGLDDLPLKFKVGDNIDEFLKMGKKDPIMDTENMRGVGQNAFGDKFSGLEGAIIDPATGMPMGMPMGGKPSRRGQEGAFGEEHHGRHERFGDRRRDEREDRRDRDESNRRQIENQNRMQEMVENVTEQNKRNGIHSSHVRYVSDSASSNPGGVDKDIVRSERPERHQGTFQGSGDVYTGDSSVRTHNLSGNSQHVDSVLGKGNSGEARKEVVKKEKPDGVKKDGKDKLKDDELYLDEMGL